MGSLLKKGHKKMDEKKVGEAIKAMKNQIAIIQKIPEYLGLKEKTDKQIEERQTAIEALEKQLPKKVDVWANGTEHCPVCDKDLTYTGLHICPECYQRLCYTE